MIHILMALWLMGDTGVVSHASLYMFMDIGLIHMSYFYGDGVHDVAIVSIIWFHGSYKV